MLLARLLVAVMRIVRAIAAVYAFLSLGGLWVALSISPEDPVAQLESAKVYTASTQATMLVVSLLLFFVLRPLINDVYTQVKPGKTLLRSSWHV